MSYESPMDAKSRPHQSLPTPFTKTARSSYSNGIEVLDSSEPVTKVIQELVQATLEVTKGQQQLIKEGRKVEQSAKNLTAMNQVAYIAWKSSYKVYKQTGDRRMVELMDTTLQEFCAEFICEIELGDFLLLENSDLTGFLDIHFDINEANRYEATLTVLFMKPKEFSRVDVEDYCTAFLGALQKNPNFLNPDCGGAHPKIINRMFLSGIQTSHFRARIEKYDTENVKETFAAIKKVLPKYQESISMDMVPAIKSPPHIKTSRRIQHQHQLLPRHLLL